PSELLTEAQSYREKLVESIAETNDDLINKYLEGEEISNDELIGALRTAIANRQMVPILCAAGSPNIGIQPVMDAIVDYLPSPAGRGAIQARDAVSGEEVTVQPAESEPLLAFVFKTTADPFVGKLTYFRVYSGSLNSNSSAYNPVRGRDERIGQLYVIRGKNQEPIDKMVAGDIGAVAKLQETVTGDTLSQKDRQLTLPGLVFPRPSFAVAIAPKTKADLDKLGSALSRLVEEDPTILVQKEPDTGETILSGMGESHVDVAMERMRRKFGVEVETSVPKVPYKETIQAASKAEYKHKKQTGGHGQYGHVFLEVEPLPRGSGFEFAERVV
ncbi:MAG: EF-Tu/IF-2/RF-3 family GTPase, partial [Dehalococcoidales bacterium]|nr:EF-Tu/IF-2/RF-3 family GTPase [Dehalococcoidales bacterium]